jgi:DNA-binding Xre family transcriptional regulator
MFDFDDLDDFEQLLNNYTNKRIMTLSEPVLDASQNETTEISSNSIAKLGKNEPVRMDVLMKIATVLDCKVEDLFETVKDEDNDK